MRPLSTQVKETIQGFYDEYPFPGKLGAYGPWREQAPALLRASGIDPESAHGARVLDAGCGTGEYSRSFAALGAEVLALDVSEGALSLARAHDKELGLSGVEYRAADVLTLDVDGTFDFVVSLGVLHHTANPEGGFRNLAPLVKPGGHLVVGLYSSVSRLHILALRQFLRVVSLGNRERAISIAQRWLRPILPLFVGREGATDRRRIADLLANPHEMPVSLYDALKWFKAAGFEVVACSPSDDPAEYGLIHWVARKRGGWLSCLLIQLRWVLWNADYYVITGRRTD